jgi:hypothetical protein
MKMSFSSETKLSVCQIPVKKRCCKIALLYGLLFSTSDFSLGKIKFVTDNEKIALLCSQTIKSLLGLNTTFSDTDKRTSTQPTYRLILSEESKNKLLDVFHYTDLIPQELFVCEECLKLFFRGLFLSVGTISNPSSGYHLEFSVSQKDRCYALCNLLCDSGFPAKITTRKGIEAVYSKESEAIEDFLTFIGAPKASLSIMNVKILRDIRNNENRRNNCDTANIYKSTGAATQQVHAIKKIQQENRLASLPEPIQTTALLRLANPEVSMSELAALHDPPITKSGVSHRLKKLVDISETPLNNKSK